LSRGGDVAEHESHDAGAVGAVLLQWLLTACVGLELCAVAASHTPMHVPESFQRVSNCNKSLWRNDYRLSPVKIARGSTAS